MITEDYVSSEIAKLLKEKGFNEETEYVFSNNGELLRLSHLGIKDLTNSDCNGYHTWQFPIENVASIISAPTLQMAIKWLREVHNIHTEICLYKTNKDDIEPKKSRKAPYYTFGVWDTVTGENVDKRLTNDFIGDTYEQACEAAIKYCLENLI